MISTVDMHLHELSSTLWDQLQHPVFGAGMQVQAKLEALEHAMRLMHVRQLIQDMTGALMMMHRLLDAYLATERQFVHSSHPLM